ncbi:hypothetical protein JTB14_034366 [Gonioctena quinquepunctata]|nr:hypothetical protein JTB14_034366 [Gonioctena quinquepunctata]
MNPARAQKLNETIVGDHFKKVEQIIYELDMKSNPQNLFNMDEKGCRLILAQEGTKRVHLVAPEHAENVTIVGCCNAIENSIPPMIITREYR